ncbi:MAG TPA: 4-alpha-glucanotransferase [Xanthobacteraceae bacterium]|nr:4-alpha-glucanotransferase [Xanthobacteraceae bacterium]
MDGVFERAAQWGIETQHHDGLGRHWTVDPAVLARVLDAIGATDGAPGPQAPQAVNHQAAYQGDDSLGRRSWAVAVQLYGIRSRHNWGHGDFSDLADLIEIAGALGASAIGLNPLHALFDDRPNEASPYYPNSRHFLNPLYIDVESIPEFPQAARGQFESEIEVLRKQELVDYANVARIKMAALTLAHENFRKNGTDERRQQFAAFRQQRGDRLEAYAAFEVLRRRFQQPWWQWPLEWRKPTPDALVALRASDAELLAFVEFLQWIAHQQLAACRDLAQHAGLPIGLYLDMAVGVRPDGFDAWSDQDVYLPSIEIGAPPDALNTQGQRWGLAGVNPAALIATNCDPFRALLRASMQYAGAIRLDHVLGLKRLYLVPNGVPADQGAYVRFPFEPLLAAAADESVKSKCIVIGEDLGTVPPGFRETLASWGLWSYHVMLFERADDGGFISPDLYRENALVTFGTHDLPTFPGWTSSHDLGVKRALGIDPGETDADRAAALDALHRAMAWRGLPVVDYPSVTRFIASTPSRILVVTMEDVLGLTEQVNVPGTVDEHPNWRRRLPVDLDECRDHLAPTAAIMTEAGRRTVGPR